MIFSTCRGPHKSPRPIIRNLRKKLDLNIFFFRPNYIIILSLFSGIPSLTADAHFYQITAALAELCEQVVKFIILSLYQYFCEEKHSIERFTLLLLIIELFLSAKWSIYFERHEWAHTSHMTHTFYLLKEIITAILTQPWCDFNWRNGELWVDDIRFIFDIYLSRRPSLTISKCFIFKISHHSVPKYFHVKAVHKKRFSRRHLPHVIYYPIRI